MKLGYNVVKANVGSAGNVTGYGVSLFCGDRADAVAHADHLAKCKPGQTYAVINVTVSYTRTTRPKQPRKAAAH